MGRELMWVCALPPEDFQERTTRLCLDANKSVGLPENVFQLPLHISLKKSFETENFEEAKVDILNLLHGTDPFSCMIDKVELHRNMLWLSLVNDGKLRLLHEELDRMLEAKYCIPISRYDRVFQPHISLFTRGTREQMEAMHERLQGADFGSEVEMSRFVIGSSGHKDAFYDLK